MNTNKTRWIEFPNLYFSKYLTKNFYNYYPNNDFFPCTEFNTICNDEKEFHLNDLFKIYIRFKKAVQFLSQNILCFLLNIE